MQQIITKRSLATTILTLTLIVTPNVSFSALSVFDASNLRTNISQYLQLIKQVKIEYDQLQNIQSAVREAEKQVQAITGKTGIGSLLNGPEYKLIRRHLPSDTRRILDALSRGQIPTSNRELSEGLEALLDLHDIFQDYNDLSTAQLKEEAQNVRNQTLSNNAVGQVMAENSLRVAGTTNIDTLEALLEQLDDSEDIKTTLDLIARMSIENSLIINQLLQVQAQEAARNSRNDLNDMKQDRLGGIRNDLNDYIGDPQPWQ